MFSKTEVRAGTGRLTVDCKDVPEASADLRDPECRAAVLERMDGEFGIRTVVLSHFVERQYGPHAMDALRGILEVARLAAQMGRRAPAPNFPGASKRQVAARCGACPFHPKALFEGLRTELVRDLETYRGRFLEEAERLARYREPGCRACVSATANDLVFLFRESRSLGEAFHPIGPPEGGA